MLMLGIATILQRLKAICFQVLSYVMALKTKLLSGITGAKVMSLMTQSVVRIKSLLVQTWLKIKPQLVRYLIIAVLLIKAGLIVVLQALGHLGQKLLTIARKTLQRVKQVLKLDNQPVKQTMQVQLQKLEIHLVLTLMVMMYGVLGQKQIIHVLRVLQTSPTYLHLLVLVVHLTL